MKTFFDLTSKIMLILLTTYLGACGVCEQQHSCSTTDNSKVETNTNEEPSDEEKREKAEVVITDEDSLPTCDNESNNMTAYRESSNKFFICSEYAWEEFYPLGKGSVELDTLNKVWDDAKHNFPDDNYLFYVCSAILTVNSNHDCQNETEGE